MRPAHGFRFRKRDWSIVAYFQGTVIAGADVRSIMLYDHATEIFREHVARLLISFGFRREDAYHFAYLPFRSVPELKQPSIGVPQH